MDEKVFNWKSFWLGFGIGLLLLIIPAISLELYVHKKNVHIFKNNPILAQKKFENKTIIGKELFSKRLFQGDYLLGQVTDIEIGSWDATPGVKIGIAGQGEALFTDLKGQVKTTVKFEKRFFSSVNLLKINGEKDCEFINRGGWSEDASLINHQGKIIWICKSPVGNAIDDMGAGVLGNDRKLCFVVGFNGTGGIRLLDENGKKLWAKPGANIWHVEIVDPEGSGSPVILHSNAGGNIIIRDKTGAILSKVKPDSGYCSHFSLCHWPDKNSPLYILHAAENKLWIMNLKGKAVATFPAPLCTELGEARGVPCRLKSSQNYYFAVSVVYKGLNHGAIFYIFNHFGKLVYQETTAESLNSVAVLPSENNGNESILVGGKNRIWKYSLNDH